MSTAPADEPMHGDPSQTPHAQADAAQVGDARADGAQIGDAQVGDARVGDVQAADDGQADAVRADDVRADDVQAGDAQADAALAERSPAGHTLVGHTLVGQAADHAQAEDAQADHAADAMKDQLRKDVASWREGRSEGSGRGATELSVAVARSIVPPTNARMKRAKPVVSEVKPASTEKKPFGMSYDGTSRSDYIKLMIARGAR
jgi:hypothetical protein